MLSSRLDSSRENQSRTWRKIWRTLIEACRWISPPLRSTHTSPLAKVMEQKHQQEHSEIWRSESCRTSGFTTSVLQRIPKRTQRFAWHVDLSSCCSLQNLTECELKWTSETPQDWWAFFQTTIVKLEQQSTKDSSCLNSTSHQPTSDPHL